MPSKLLAWTTAVALLGAPAAALAETTLVIGMASDPTGLDPEAVENNTCGFIMSTVYDSLLRYETGTSDVAPGIAESWTTSPDGLTCRLKLESGVTFSDGTPLDAEAVTAACSTRVARIAGRNPASRRTPRWRRWATNTGCAAPAGELDLA